MFDSSFEIMNRVEEKHWWFRVRRELLVLLLNKYQIKNQEMSILDVGCGTGLNSVVLSDFGVVSSLDVSVAALDYCRAKGLTNVYSGSAEELPFHDGSFDVVVAMDVLEHLNDDVKAANEIRRVLKNGGLFICFVPAFQFLWSKQDEILMHHRRYTRFSLINLFCNGWQKIRVSYFNSFLFLMILCVRFFERFLRLKQRKDEVEKMSFFNKLFYLIFRSELPILSNFNFPFGVSLLGVFKKTE